jgi:hypothetical protein
MNSNTNHNGTIPAAPAQTAPQNTMFDQAALKQYFQKSGISFSEEDGKLYQTAKGHVYVDDHYRHADLGNVELMGDFNGDSLFSFRAGEFVVGGDFITNAKSVKFDALLGNNIITPKAEFIKGQILSANDSVYANDAINIIVSDKIEVKNNLLSNKADVIESRELIVGKALFANQLKIVSENRKIGNRNNIPFDMR